MSTHITKASRYPPLTTRPIIKLKNWYTCFGQASRKPRYTIRPYKSFCHTDTAHYRDYQSCTKVWQDRTSVLGDCKLGAED